MDKIRKSIKTTFYAFVFAFILTGTILGMGQTYAWFSSLVSVVDGDLNLGEMSAVITLYENYDDSLGGDSFVDGITDAHSINSAGTNMTAYSMIQKDWYANDYTSLYIEVENTGTIDLKSIFKIYSEDDNVQTFVSYYYYQVIEITTEVEAFANPTSRENISAYNTSFQSTISSGYQSYKDDVTTNGHSISSNLSYINLGTTEVSGKNYYRLDIALTDIPTELLTEYNALDSEEKQIDVTSIITIKQTNAPNDDNEDSGLAVYVSSADAFINAINDASNGDTIYLTTDISVPRNITVTHRVNLNLNGHTLTIAGNLAYDTANPGSVTIDVSNNSVLNVHDSLIIDVPNATFKLLGDGGQAQSIFIGSEAISGSGDFYVNALRDDNDTSVYGFYQYGLSVMKVISQVATELATMRVDSNTRVTIGVGALAGNIQSVANATNIEVYNLGQLTTIDFSTMSQMPQDSVQIYIYNRNRFTTSGTVITLPTWSLGWKSKELYTISNPINTRVINAPGSIIGYSVTGSSVFTDIDIENGDDTVESVIDLGGNYYRVNVQLDGAGFDTLTLNYFLLEYYNNLHNNATQEEYEAWLTTIDGLELYTYNTAVVKTNDFSFIKSFVTGLQYLDFEHSSVENNLVPDNGLSNMSTLQTVKLPITELSIGSSAFSGTSIDKITLTSAITSIGANAFDINTTQNGMLEVFYESENVNALNTFISGLTSSKTLLFMSEANLQNFKAGYVVTDEWYINSYLKYDFIDTHDLYYRILDSSNVEVVYYSGLWSGMNLYNTVVNDVNTYDVISIAYSTFRRSINSAGTTAIDVNIPTNITQIKADVFYGAYINSLNLNNVNKIGNYAFSNSTIYEIEQRGGTFLEMESLGDYAFESSQIGVVATTIPTFEASNVTGGQLNNNLDLHGDYTPGVGVFNSADIFGTVLNLQHIDYIGQDLTNNLSLYGVELLLDNITLIGESAFDDRFDYYDVLYSYNKISATEVKTIERYAFRYMELDEFVIGVKSLYSNQIDVDANVEYGSSSYGIIDSNFKSTNLIVDGMLPQLVYEERAYILGTTTSGRDYNNVTIKNTNGLFYDYLLYSSSSSNQIDIDVLNLHDITSIGEYSFYYADVNAVNFYELGVLKTVNQIQTVERYAFRYSQVDSLGVLNLTQVDSYAFANTEVPASSLSIVGDVAASAFRTSYTTNVSTISITGNLANYVFRSARIYTVASIYIEGNLGTLAFGASTIYDCTSFIIKDSVVGSRAFSGASVGSACNFELQGSVNLRDRAFQYLNASQASLHMENALLIEEDVFEGSYVNSIYLGNTDFYTNNNGSFIYGDNGNGVFGDGANTTLTNLYLQGELPSQRNGNYVLGAEGFDVNIANIYVGSAVSILPDQLFNSSSQTTNLNTSNLYIDSENLQIGSSVFTYADIDNIEYRGTSAGQIDITGSTAFYQSRIGNFTGFTFYNGGTGETTGVLYYIAPHSFEYTIFESDSDLTVFNYVNQIGNEAFDHATFEQTSGGQDVSFDFTKVVTIGYNIFENIYSSIGTLTLGNDDYYSASLAGYYYGNPAGDEGILASAGTIVIDEIIIAGNMPNVNVTEMYQTRVLGKGAGVTITVNNITVNSNVTNLPEYTFAGAGSSDKTQIVDIDINSSTLSIKDFAFAYTEITNLTMYSSDIDIYSNAFEYSEITTMTYDRSGGVGEINFVTGSEYGFQYSRINNIVGFTSGSTGVVNQITDYAFYYAVFGQDVNLSWIGYSQKIGNYAFSHTTFTKTSGDNFVSLDISDVVTVGDAIFAFIPIKIGTLTVGNSSYQAIHGADYTYGYGAIGTMFAAGDIDVLNIVGNLPTTNSYSSLGNTYFDGVWSVKYGRVNVSSSVTQIPESAILSEYSIVPVQIGLLDVNSTNLTIGASAFKNSQITTINFDGSVVSISQDAFYSSALTTVNFNGNQSVLGSSAFAFTTITTVDFGGDDVQLGSNTFNAAQITNFNYTGSTSGEIAMIGTYTFASATIQNVNGLTYAGGTQGIIDDISDHAFEGAVFASDLDLRFIENAEYIGEYAFSGATFTKTSLDNFVDLDLTEVISIGKNAFYHLPIGLGTINLGNDSLSSNPSYYHGDGVEGIFNNAGTIEHLIIEGELPSTPNALGNQTSNLTYVTTYGIVQINSGISTLPNGLFAAGDSVYSTNIGALYLYPTNITLGDSVFKNTTITDFNMPNQTTFSGVGGHTFENANIVNKNFSYGLTITDAIGDYAFYGFNFTGVVLDVTSVTSVGEYAFAGIVYNGSMSFNNTISLIAANYMFANANISGNIIFNSVNSIGSNMFFGIISGTSVTYSFTFENTILVTSDYVFANMNGGGTVFLTISNIPTLNSYRAFYNSTNIITISFDEDLVSLNADNIFENADNLVTVAFNNETQVTVVNSTIVTIPNDVSVYVPGTMLVPYLMDANWALIASQISTNYNIDASTTWGFYIIGTSTNASLVKYLGSQTTVTIPTTITYDSTTYDVLALEASLFAATAVTTISIPRGIPNVDMDMFSNSNISNVSFTGSGAEPFYIANESGNIIIYESSSKLVLYKYLASNTSTSYTIPDSVIKLSTKAFYRNDYLQTLTFDAGVAQTVAASQYETDYKSDFILSGYAISEMQSLQTITIRNQSSGYAIMLNSYAISSNPSLETINLTSFNLSVGSYAIHNNTSLELALIERSTAWAYGYITFTFFWQNYEWGSPTYTTAVIEPYAFYGSGESTGSPCFYINYNYTKISDNAFKSSKVTLFEFDVDILADNHGIEVYNPNAFAVGVSIDINGNGDIVQTYEDITIRVPSNRLNNYRNLTGFSFYYNDIVGVTNFTHTI